MVLSEPSPGIAFLCGTAASLGILHALLGPDHYLPFIAMARAGRWSLAKTVSVTVLCGLGHVLGSVALGTVGIASGVGVFRLQRLESMRGELAGWLLLAFGVVYFAWGLRRVSRRKAHSHVHIHADGTVHCHVHVHSAHHAHVHVAVNPGADGRPRTDSVTPWVLFTIFVFGPCEPLIPLLMYPAATGQAAGVVPVVLIFGAATVVTMTMVVAMAHVGLNGLAPRWGARFARMERYGHALAGLVLVLCGAAIQTGL